MIESLITPDVSALMLAFFNVLLIDIVLAGDNAVAVGLAAAGLPVEQRKKVIALGLVAAVALRILFALIAAWLLGFIGLLLAGGVLLLWVCYKMWQELGQQNAEDEETAIDSTDDAAAGISAPSKTSKTKTFAQAFLQIFIADVSMSLDNVLAVAGAAREHPVVLVFGLLLSIILMGLAANLIAKLLHKHRWIGYVGLIIVLVVAVRMVWEGHREVVIEMDQTAGYNQVMPDPLKISAEEIHLHDDKRLKAEAMMKSAEKAKP